MRTAGNSMFALWPSDQLNFGIFINPTFGFPGQRATSKAGHIAETNVSGHKLIEMRFLLVILTVTVMNCSTRNENRIVDISFETDNETMTSELLRRGNLLYEISDYKNASLTYDSVIRLDSTIGEVYYKKGFADSQINEIVESSKCFKKAIQFKYRVADSYFNLGLNQIMIDNDSITFDNDASSPRAIEYFEQCLKSNPNKQTEKEALEMIKAFKKNRTTVL